MHRNGVMNLRLNTSFTQIGQQRISFFHPNDVQVIHVCHVTHGSGQDQVSVFQQCRVVSSQLLSLLVPPRKVSQLDPQNRRLQFVKPAIASFHLADVSADPTVLSQQTQAFDHLNLFGDNHSSISHRPEVLGRVEAESCCVTPTAHRLASIVCTVRLGAILNHGQTVAPRNCQNRLYVSRMTVQVHGQNCAGTDRNR